MPGCLVFLALVFFAPVAAQGQSLTRDDRKLFAWFDSLGYAPDLRDPPFVLVSSGGWSQSSGQPEKQAERYVAFLLGESGAEFKILTLDLQIRSFSRAPASGDRMAVGFEPSNLEQLAARVVESAQTSVDFSSFVDIPGLWRSQVRYLVLARACAARGLNEASHALIAAAQAVDLGDPKPRDFRADVGDTMARSQYAEALMDLQAGKARIDVRDRLKRLVHNFPKAEVAAESRADANVLDRMTLEDADHARRQASGARRGDARIADLIFQLRDEVGYQFFSPGGVYFLTVDFWGTTHVATGPAQQLADVGYPAVPQLIDALSTPGLTRTYYYRNGPRSIVTIHEAVTEILEAISGLDFDEEDASGNWRQGPTIAAARRWWRDFNANGEYQTLVAGALAGHEGQASLLVRKYPAAAGAVLERAMNGTRDEIAQLHLVRAAAGLHTGDELPVLRAGLRARRGDTLLQAAEALTARGHEDETIAPLVAAWNDSETMFVLWGDRLAKKLAEMPDRRGIEALGSRWKERDFDAKAAAIFGLERADPAATNRATAERILAEALDDKTTRGMGFGTSDIQGSPRICDLAARALASRWAEKYHFDGLTPVEERDAQIAVMKGIRREKRAADRSSHTASSALRVVQGACAVPFFSPFSPVSWDFPASKAATPSRSSSFPGRRCPRAPRGLPVES